MLLKFCLLSLIIFLSVGCDDEIEMHRYGQMEYAYKFDEDPTSEWQRMATGGDGETVVEADTGTFALRHGGQCRYVTGRQLDEFVRNSDGIFTYTESQICEGCVVWSIAPQCSVDCPNRCDRMCPGNVNILSHVKERTPASRDTTFPFVNSSNTFKQADFHGYCTGMVHARKKFNRVAFFEKDEKPRRADGTEITNEDEKFAFYRNLVDKVFRNEPVKIPGFKNLNKFADDPAIQEYLTHKIEDEWVEKSKSTYLSMHEELANGLDNTEANHFISQVQQKLLLTGSLGLSYYWDGTDENGQHDFKGHFVEAYEMRDLPGGGKKICVVDPNLRYRNRSRCKSYFKLVGTRLTYHRPRKGKTEVVEVKHMIPDRLNEERDTVDTIPKLQRFCKRDRGCELGS